MKPNHKLTRLFQDRTVKSGFDDANAVTITFDDQSALKLKLGGQATVTIGAKIKTVYESGKTSDYTWKTVLPCGSAWPIQGHSSSCAIGMARLNPRGKCFWQGSIQGLARAFLSAIPSGGLKCSSLCIAASL